MATLPGFTIPVESPPAVWIFSMLLSATLIHLLGSSDERQAALHSFWLCYAASAD